MGVAAPEIHRPDLPTTSGPPSGLDGVVLGPGDHICCFDTGSEQRDRIVPAFRGAGMQHGDECSYLVDPTDPDLVRRRVEVPSRPAPDQLGRRARDRDLPVVRPVVRRPDDQGLRRAERDVVGTACFPFVRAEGETSWVLCDPPGADELVGDEAAINDLAPRYLQALLWLYDVRRFDAAMLVDAVRAHPKMPIGNLLAENPWCMSALERWVSGADSFGLCEHRGQGGAE
ncbi:MEDS domain-containing protein [Pseudonocardia sp. NPDC049154]|uniref:MEDS domain-containing protein n=1 Tax=Pseudonocardia sp. NPDC049154 TaxID=3155501 RepID=UPI0033D0B84B